MRIFCLVVLCAVLCLRVVSYATAEAPSYLGAWTVSKGAPAPWAAQASADTRLVGRTVVFKSDAIAGPAPFACADPRYRLRDLTPAKIFRGELAALQARDRGDDVELLAAKLGFAGPGITTLQTGCGIDVHFLRTGSAQVALGGTIYTLSKQ